MLRVTVLDQSQHRFERAVRVIAGEVLELLRLRRSGGEVLAQGTQLCNHRARYHDFAPAAEQLWQLILQPDIDVERRLQRRAVHQHGERRPESMGRPVKVEVLARLARFREPHALLDVWMGEVFRAEDRCALVVWYLRLSGMIILRVFYPVYWEFPQRVDCEP